MSRLVILFRSSCFTNKEHTALKRQSLYLGFQRAPLHTVSHEKQTFVLTLKLAKRMDEHRQVFFGRKSSYENKTDIAIIKTIYVIPLQELIGYSRVANNHFAYFT